MIIAMMLSNRWPLTLAVRETDRIQHQNTYIAEYGEDVSELNPFRYSLFPWSQGELVFVY